MRLLRSILFTPGNNMRMIYKTPTLAMDAVILDLEDSVPMIEKDTARVFIRDTLDLAGSGGAEVYVRINGLMTGLTAQDCDFVIQKGLDGVMLPKVESKEDVIESEKIIEKLEKERGMKSGSIVLIPTLETAKGVVNVYEIAVSSKRVIAIGFGAVDFTRDMGTSLSKEGTELFFARSQVAIAARAAGVQALDTVFIDLADKEGLIKDSQLAKQLGFKGKFLIHPSQIEPVNQIFSPLPKEIEYAKKVVSAFKEAEARGLGAASLEGRMIDIAVFRQAEDLLALAEAIAKKEKKK
ncbi:MAG: CoA ester lyase [Candidatus Bathyarchaeota archaeon]|nr:CoA ester lyase [Candidatus Bathyarchaeota archaeon]